MLSPVQKAVYLKCLDFITFGEEQCYIVSGIAGSGKSTIIREIMNSPLDKDGMILCPTGRATTRFEEMSAWTIHSVLYKAHQHADGSVTFSKRDPKEAFHLAKFFIVDEASMVNSEQIDLLLKIGRPILFFGDAHQLPPINDANFSIMEMADFHLNEIHRNVAESKLYQFIDHYRRNRTFDWSLAGSEIITVKKHDLTKPYFEKNNFDAVIVTYNKEKDKYNRLIRVAKGFVEEMPQVGDLIMSLRNNSYSGVYVPNGSRAYITKIQQNNEDPELIDYECVSEDNETKTFTASVHYQNWQNPLEIPSLYRNRRFDFGYAMTVWKAQGSEFQNVLYVMSIPEFVDSKEKLIYTALSRAKERLTIAK